MVKGIFSAILFEVTWCTNEFYWQAYTIYFPQLIHSGQSNMFPWHFFRYHWVSESFYLLPGSIVKLYLLKRKTLYWWTHQFLKTFQWFLTKFMVLSDLFVVLVNPCSSLWYLRPGTWSCFYNGRIWGI